MNENILSVSENSGFPESVQMDASGNDTVVTGYSSRALYPTWIIGHAYNVGDTVYYNGYYYHCLIAHTSQDTWSPDEATTLWSLDSVEQEESSQIIVNFEYGRDIYHANIAILFTLCIIMVYLVLHGIFDYILKRIYRR